MKKIITLLIAATLIIAAAMMLNSCSQWDIPYEKLDKDGNTVSVEFNPGQGSFAGTVVTIVDVFSYDDVNGFGVKLLSPDDKARGEGNAYTPSCKDHTFGGWYVAKTDGNGNVTPDLTKPWDFKKDILDSDYLAGGKGTSSEDPVLTLCAYWIPYTSYNIHIPDGNGGFKSLATVKTNVLKLPVWTDKGNLDLKSIPEWEGMTFTGAYLDEALTNKITAETYEIEVPKGETDPKVDIYTTWDEGVWFRITTANQLNRNAISDGCYLIMNDLDFAQDTWPTALSDNTFEGKLVTENGKSVKISNVSLFASTGATKSGLFGGIDEGAEIKNISFENIKCEIEGTTKEAKFALFAPSVDENAVIENVSLSGILTLVNDYATTLYPYIENTDGQAKTDIIDIGIISASGNINGVTCGEITVGFKTPDEIPDATVTVNDDGTVKVTPQS